MNPYATPESDTAQQPMPGQDKEVPSSIVTACHRLAGWQLAAGIVFAGFASGVAYLALLLDSYVRLICEATGRQQTSGQLILSGGVWMFAVFTGANAFLAFRNYQSLRGTGKDRRVHSVHRTMKCLRWQWRVFGVTLALTLLGLSLPAFFELISGDY